MAGCFTNNSLDINAMSYADVKCSSSSSPWQFLNVVSFIPNSLVLSFIIWTKFSSVPPRYSAIAVTQSFALTTAIAFNISFTLNVSVVSSQICEPPILAALVLHGIWVSSEILPESKASIISKRLITFVTLAGCNFSWILCSYNICPLFCSIKIAEAESKFKKLPSCIEVSESALETSIAGFTTVQV